MKYNELERTYEKIYSELRIPYSALGMADHYKAVYKGITKPTEQTLDNLIKYVDCRMNEDLFMLKPPMVKNKYTIQEV